MAGQRLPIELVLANGKKHFTKDEIVRRRNSEIQPITDNIVAPDYLTKKQKQDFNKYAEQLQRLKIMEKQTSTR